MLTGSRKFLLQLYFWGVTIYSMNNFRTAPLLCWVCSVVLAHVPHQLHLPQERAWAQAALKGPLAGVLAHVNLEVLLPWKRAQANGALERFLFRVNSLVPHYGRAAHGGVRAEAALVAAPAAIGQLRRLLSSSHLTLRPVVTTVCMRWWQMSWRRATATVTFCCCTWSRPPWKHAVSK